ncbi:MAG: hypothetical protein QM658_09635, partial [Gordonia sp. (in: high G+C Gram-positive bacteria)]
SKQDMVAEVVRQGKAKGMSDADIESAVAVMLAESDGKNYANSNVAGSTDRPHDAVGSDGKSLGVMQQQSGMGWGDDDQLMDPKYAIGKYYERLGEVEGREQMSVAQRSQAVQRSAFADGSNYAAKQDEARKLIAEANSVPTTPAGNVPVEVKSQGAGTSPSTPSAPTVPSGTTPHTATPGAATPTVSKSDSMRFGKARADTWLGEQDWNATAKTWGVDAIKEIGGDFLGSVGLDNVWNVGVDRIVEAIEKQTKDGGIQLLLVDKTRDGVRVDKSKEGQTAVRATYRNG